MDALANYFIRKYPDNFVSGTDDCNIIMIKAGSYYNMQLNNILILIAIGINYNPTKINVFDAHDYIRSRLLVDARFQKLSEWSNHLRTVYGINSQIIAYPTLPEYQENNWNGSEEQHPFDEVKFYIHLDGTNSKVVNGKQLRDMIHGAVGYTGELKTEKPMNKQLSTYLQYWNRNCLGKCLKVVDLDGSFFNLHRADVRNALLEIKRSDFVDSKDGLWHPFINDGTNYKLYDFVAKSTNSAFLLMKHLPDEKIKNILLKDDYILTYYDISGIDESKYRNLNNQLNNLKEEYKRQGRNPKDASVWGEFLLTSYLSRSITLGDVCNGLDRFLFE